MKMNKTLKKSIRKEFTDSNNRLFDAAWRQLATWVRQGAIDDPTCEADIINWIDQIISEKVNNPRSRFYIYG